VPVSGRRRIAGRNEDCALLSYYSPFSSVGCVSAETAVGNVDSAVFFVPSACSARADVWRAEGEERKWEEVSSGERRCPMRRRALRRSLTDDRKDEGEELDEATVMSSTGGRDELDQSGMKELEDEDHDRENEDGEEHSKKNRNFRRLYNFYRLFEKSLEEL
jgi:hypothetical protein